MLSGTENYYPRTSSDTTKCLRCGTKFLKVTIINGAPYYFYICPNCGLPHIILKVIANYAYSDIFSKIDGEVEGQEMLYAMDNIPYTGAWSAQPLDE